MLTRQLLSKLFRLSRSERVDLVVAQGALLAAWFRVATRPRGQLVGASAASDANATLPDDEARAHAHRLALAIMRVANHGPFRPQCLVRAVALKRLLDEQGLAGSCVKIGVRSQQGAFAAHAWVEYGSEILGDRADHVGSFVPFTDIMVIER